MPKIRFALVSARNRPVDDPISTFILDAERGGIIRDERNILHTSKRWAVDAAPGKYAAQIEIGGFRLFAKNLIIDKNSPDVIPLPLTHLCKDLPELDELNPAQQALLELYAPGSDPRSVWSGLSENRAATFFQITHALSQKELANGRTLASYIASVRRIAGVRMEDDLPDGKLKTATGWRMHVIIRQQDRARIEAALTDEGVFGKKADVTCIHPTHKRFGLIRSFREQAALPRIQIVLDQNNEHADLDVDIGFHRSSPHDVYRDFIRKYPEVSGIYKY
jgi:hypothetical protein